MPQVTVTCDRCGEIVSGIQTEVGTSGFYCRSEPAGPWNTFMAEGENILCDDCMFKDPRYRQSYGLHVK